MIVYVVIFNTQYGLNVSVHNSETSAMREANEYAMTNYGVNYDDVNIASDYTDSIHIQEEIVKEEK